MGKNTLEIRDAIKNRFEIEIPPVALNSILSLVETDEGRFIVNTDKSFIIRAGYSNGIDKQYSKQKEWISLLRKNYEAFCNRENVAFPTLLSLINMFFACGAFFRLPFAAACMLTGLILLSVGLTFACSKLLSKTLLKGEASSFVLEMPAYRRPQIGKVIVRSVLDRTLFVLGRAAAVAAPAGLLLWLMANISIGGSSIMVWCAQFLQPFANLLGLDGAILLAFILGLPANEIVIPIVLMLYTGAGTMMELGDLAAMKTLLIANGWTIKTALCTLLFMLVHWPCSTTLITIRKETGSWKWMWLAATLPALAGALLCMLVNFGFFLFA